MLSPLASVVRLASLVLCLIVIASFALFVIDQTGDASAHQQAELNHGTPATTASPSQAASTRAHPTKSSLGKTIDKASDAVTSPFSEVTDRTSSQWLIHIINLLLALLVYGFGLGFLARVIRVRL